MKTSNTCFMPFNTLLAKVSAALSILLFFLFSISISGSALAQDSSSPLGRLIFKTSVPGSSSGITSESLFQNNNTDTENDALSNILQNQAFNNSIAEDYQDAINESIDNGDLYSQTLSEQHEALGIMLYRSGNYESAIESFDDAIHFHKVNKGLFNLDQARLIGHLIDVYTELGDFPSVDNNKHYLYYIQKKPEYR